MVSLNSKKTPPNANILGAMGSGNFAKIIQDKHPIKVCNYRDPIW